MGIFGFLRKQTVEGDVPPPPPPGMPEIMGPEPPRPLDMGRVPTSPPSPMPREGIASDALFDRSMEKSMDRSMDRPADRPADRPMDSPVDGPMGGPVGGSMENHGFVPPPPKPHQHDLGHIRNNSEPKHGIPIGDMSVPSNPKGTIDLPDLPSFTQKFGTHPDPKMQKKIEQDHIIHKDTKNQKSFTKRESNTKPTQKEGLPLHEHISRKIDEHVEEQFSFSGAKKETVVEKPTFTKPALTKPTFPKPVFTRPTERKALDMDKPIYLSLHDGEEIIAEIMSAKDIAKKSESLLFELTKLKEKKDSEYDSWHALAEKIRTDLTNVDKKLFTVM